MKYSMIGPFSFLIAATVFAAEPSIPAELPAELPEEEITPAQLGPGAPVEPPSAEEAVAPASEQPETPAHAGMGEAPAEAPAAEKIPEVVVELPTEEAKTTVIDENTVAQDGEAAEEESALADPNPMAKSFMLIDDHCSISAASATDATLVATLGALMKYRCSMIEGFQRVACEMTAQDNKTLIEGKSSVTIEFAVEENAGNYLLTLDPANQIHIVDRAYSSSGVYPMPATGGFASKLCVGHLEMLETL